MKKLLTLKGVRTYCILFKKIPLKPISSITGAINAPIKAKRITLTPLSLPKTMEDSNEKIYI